MCEGLIAQGAPQHYWEALPSLHTAVVCGEVGAYQFGTPDAFRPSSSIDDPYVDGVSITHGSPRQHIWTLAATATETLNATGCPCSGGTDSRPSFVGNDYFCDSATTTNSGAVFYEHDRLWDASGCSTSTCCSFNNPPHFYKQLPQLTDDNIELRICSDQNRDDEDTALYYVDILVK